MSTMSLLGRLGRDVDLRFLPNGDAVANMAVAYNYGKKENGNQPSQWVDCAIFGKRAEALAPHLMKGQQLFLVLEDVHVRTFEKQDKTLGVALSGKVSKIEFAGSKPSADSGVQNQNQAPQQAPRAQPQKPVPQQPAGFDSFDDDIPF